MDVTTWEEPAGRRDNSGTARQVADQLRAHVSKWAIIEEHNVPSDADAAKKLRAQASNRASLIKQGRLLPFKPRGTFDAVSRSVEVDAEGNSVNDGKIVVGSGVGGAPVEPVRKLVRVFARYLGAEFEQPEPVRQKRAKKEETAPAETTPAPADAPADVPVEDAPAAEANVAEQDVSVESS